MTEQTPPKWHRWRKWIIEILIILLIFLGIKTWQQSDLVTGMAPPLAGTSLAGTPLILQQPASTPQLIHFFAPWCPMCQLTHNSIVDLQTDHPVIWVATQTDPVELNQWLSNHPEINPKQVLPDPTGHWLHAFGSSALPTNIIIDTAGNIDSAELGYASYWGLSLKLWLAKN